MRRVFVYALLLIIGVLCALYLFMPAKTVEFSQQEVEQVVNSKLPHIIEKGVVTITVRTATLEFRRDNIVSVKTSFDAKGLTLEGEGQADFETGIHYENGNFYLTDLSKEDISFEFSQNSSETIADIRSSIEGILNREEEEAESGDTEMAESVSRVREYAATQLQKDAEEALDNFLGLIPIYSLSGQGGALKIAALALEGVTISEGKVTAVLSFQTLLIRVVWATLSVLVVVLLIFGQAGVGVLGLFSRGNDK